jgi:hypothetical protein
VSDVWVTNASPVITLAKAGYLELLTQLPSELLLPEAVAGEILAGPAAAVLDSRPRVEAVAEGRGQRNSLRGWSKGVERGSIFGKVNPWTDANGREGAVDTWPSEPCGVPIEEVAEWHAQLFLEPHIVACAAVLGKYSAAPAVLTVECERIASQWLGKARRFTLEISWSEATTIKAARLRATMQSKPLVELAAVALALVLGRRVVPLGQLDVTDYGGRADYRSLGMSRVLEISGTETLTELGRRHREKVAQAVANPFGWDAYVVVCAFSSKGHRIRFSAHRWEESARGQKG